LYIKTVAMSSNPKPCLLENMEFEVSYIIKCLNHLTTNLMSSFEMTRCPHPKRKLWI